MFGTLAIKTRIIQSLSLDVFMSHVFFKYKLHYKVLNENYTITHACNTSCWKEKKKLVSRTMDNEYEFKCSIIVILCQT